MGLHDYVQAVIAFVQRNEAWAPAVMFALAFGESLAFISLLLPAWGALITIGALVSHDWKTLLGVWVAASIGATCGDWLSYWIGLKLEHAVFNMWPLSRHPELLPRGEAFVKKW